MGRRNIFRKKNKRGSGRKTLNLIEELEAVSVTYENAKATIAQKLFEELEAITDSDEEVKRFIGQRLIEELEETSD